MFVALAGLFVARRGVAQSGVSQDAPPASFDTLRYTLPDSLDAAPLGEPSITIAAGGDTVLGYNLEAHFDTQLAAGVSREELLDYYFRGIRPVLEAADLAVVNLECPFTERGKRLPKNFNFRARRELVEILKRGSVDVASLANNHTMDWGPDGLEDTRLTLEQAGIACFGAGDDIGEARQPLIVTRNGLRVGFLGYYFQAGKDMLEPQELYARDNRAGVAGVYKSVRRIQSMVEEDLAQLTRKVDVAIPFFHWGHEGSYEVRKYQIELAHRCVDLGARAVLGAHPHRLQAVEVYKDAPIFYSLGNFVYGGIKDPPDWLTMIARMKITRGRVEADVVPVRFTRWPDVPFQPYVLEGEERNAAMRRIAEISKSFDSTLPAIAANR
jgi:poly-gamma-glutamate synthesis protein (capsule biosynthesis protein)